MKTIMLIHGIGGLSRETYFPHFKSFFESLGQSVLMPSFGSYRDGTNYAKWKRLFDQQFKPYLNKDTVVVCQSMGTQFFVKYLAEQRKEIGLYISCAGPHNATIVRKKSRETAEKFLDSALTFVPNKDEYAIFKQLDFAKYSFFSDDDCFYDQNNLKKYASSIGASPKMLHNKSHFQMEKFEELESFIKDLLNS